MNGNEVYGVCGNEPSVSVMPVSAIGGQRRGSSSGI
jgi:hypothetical protein